MLYDEIGKAHGMGTFPKCKCPHTGAVTYTKTTCLGGRDKLTKLKRPTRCRFRVEGLWGMSSTKMGYHICDRGGHARPPLHSSLHNGFECKKYKLDSSLTAATIMQRFYEHIIQ